MKKWVTAGLCLISIAIGAVFIYAAYSKLYPIQSFEFRLVEQGKLSWAAAAMSARALIIVEAVAGVLLLLHLYGRSKWVIKASALLTFVFSLYLIYLWAVTGNNADCGCFGDAVPMSPAVALLKNGLLLLGLFILNRHHKGLSFRRSWTIAPFMILAAGLLIVLLFPIPDHKPAWLGKNGYKLDLEPLYAAQKPGMPPSVELRTGKHILACLTLTCPHCRIAAKKLHLMKQRNPRLPLYMVLAGADENLSSFFSDTRASNISYSRLRGTAFINLAGLEYPAIFWIDNASVKAKTSYNGLDQNDIERWLNDTAH